MVSPGPATTPATAADRPVGETDKDRELRRVALELNPLSAIIGRYSLQVEYLPVAHHAAVLNPHFDHVTAEITAGGVTGYTEGFTGFGASS